MIGVDTNVLVRYFVQDDQKQAAAAEVFLRSECTAERPGWINRIVLCELVWVLERVYRSPREEVAGVLEALVQTAEFQVENLDAVWNALRAYRDRSADFADTLLSTTNLMHGCSKTVTFDRGGAVFPGMELLSIDTPV